VRAADGPKTLQELVERGRKKAGAMNFGAGIITTRLAAELFNREAGITAQYIPFQGSPPTVQGLMTGSVDYIIDGAAASLPLIQAGQLRALSKTNDGPVAGLPNLKSLAKDLGAPTLEDISTWIALVAPKDTPKEITTSIEKQIAKLYADPKFIEQLRQAGLNPAGSTGEELDAFIARETTRWTSVVKSIGLEMN
jgi:tripartite-type tricarboxylate transporter receptor subunit TctC